MSALPAYDPRDLLQVPHDPSTWLPTENPILIRASQAKAPRTFEFWRGVAILATLWDEEQKGAQMPRAKP
jgi:hypothetical protein